MRVSYIFIALEIYCIELYGQCIEMYMCSMYSTDIFERSACPLVVQSYTIQDEVVSLLTPRKYTVLNGHFVFHFHNVFHEHNSGTKRDLPVFCIFTGSWWPDLLDSVGLCCMVLVSLVGRQVGRWVGMQVGGWVGMQVGRQVGSQSVSHASRRWFVLHEV